MRRIKETVADVPKLMREWDAETNSSLGIFPDKLGSQSNKYAYWICRYGHKWSAKISNRYHGRGCPICSNQIVAPGINDFGTTHPELAKQWHPTKNGDLKPVDVTYGSGRKVWWICPNGHEYQATILHRTTGIGTNCPVCTSGRQTSFREQAFFYYIRKIYPQTISRYRSKELGRFELDIFIPEINTAIEYDGVAWHKEFNYEREKRKYELCQKLGIRLLRIKEKPPELGLDIADEIFSCADFETEKGLTAIIHYVISHLYLKGPYYINPLDVNLSRDRFEIMRYATEIKNSLEDCYPKIAAEWHPTKNGTLKPNMFKPKSSFKIWWLCSKCGNEYEATIRHRAYGTGCPNCSREKQVETRRIRLLEKRGSLKNTALIEDWNYEKNNLKPEDYTPSSSKKVWWKCHKCGYEWQSKISNRTHGRGCPHCAGRKLFPGENDLATVHPELLEEWDYERNVGMDPNYIHYGSSEYAWWRCKKCGHEYKTIISKRSYGSGCRKCADNFTKDKRRQNFVKRSGSLGDICPYLIPEYASDNEFSIFEIPAGSSKKVKWICSVCGHSWEASPYTRKKGHGCPKCGIKKSIASRQKA